MLRKLNRLIALAEKKGLIFTALQRRERGWSIDFYDPRKDVACNYVSGIVLTSWRPDPMQAIEGAIVWIEAMKDKPLACDVYRP